MGNNKKDAILSLVCGGLTALFLLLVIKNPYVAEFQVLAKMGNLAWILIVVLPIVFLIGFLAGRILSKVSAVFSQIVKFVEIGILNTFIDAGILNLLISLTGITSGGGLAPLNTASFLCAMTNSYFWNKFWTFKNPSASSGPAGDRATGKNFLQFLIVSGIGWGINTGFLVLVTKYFAPMFGLSSGGWANLVKLGSISISMIWNFLGYKFIVFKK